MIKVENFEKTALKPRVNNPALEKLLPKTHVPVRVSLELSPVSNAVSNALRRTITDEFPVRCMRVEVGDVSSTDPFIIPEMVAKRFRQIPISQSCPLSAKFELRAVNTGDAVRDVKASEITVVSGPKTLPFNETFTLFTLGAGKSAKITCIFVHETYGYLHGSGMHSIASGCTSTVANERLFNPFEPEAGGIHSRFSNPRHWKLEFITHGTMEPEAIMAKSCDVLIERLGQTRDLFGSIQSNGDEHLLLLAGESDTIGNLLMRTAVDLYPDIPAITYSVDDVERTCTVKMRADDALVILENVVKHLMKLFGELKKIFVA